MDSDLDDYDYDLPNERIAQDPLPNRSDARLMLVDRAHGAIAHHYVRDLPELLRAGDCLVVNDTRVVPARMVGFRPGTGGRWEGLFLTVESSGAWQILCKARGKLMAGETIQLLDRSAKKILSCALSQNRKRGYGSLDRFLKNRPGNCLSALDVCRCPSTFARAKW